ncbi:FAD-dependent monooxygenase [Candidatus Riesia pediculischaeffi]|uniref:2-octaprenyl-6-methoxyphenol hydroxylase n=1 Tax=Candidatus Riesia pediculischaeffi PTSU TaxID=1401651 RepID=A0A0C1S082_9ENTR|nr:FAD-dependent monooxygenase [Candidatus Riesia pediculischaeffi]KIE63967.1 2-octaprenyl-6-methoxyphenol hydroxylase [Candidatus Riesia pediculischaeffi PTSU]
MTIIIVGGGLTGISLTLFLRYFCRKDLEIDLIENGGTKKNHSILQERTIFLNKSTLQKFKKIKALSDIRNHIYPVKSIYISKHGCKNLLKISSEEYLSCPFFGCTTLLSKVKRYLFKKVQLISNKSTRIHHPDQVNHIKYHKNYISVRLKSGKILRAKLLISSCKINTDNGGYGIQWSEKCRQFATFMKFNTEKPFCGVSIERFTKNGSLAVLPNGTNHGTLIWFYDKDIKNNIDRLSKESFVRKVEEELPFFNNIFGKIQNLSRRSSFPIYVSTPDSLVNHRLILIGNAAQTVHPIAGQGFNLIVRDIYELSQIISKSMKKSEDFGSYMILQKYREKRKMDRIRVIQMTNMLSEIYNSSFYSYLFNIFFKFFSVSPDYLRKKLIRRILNTLHII